MSKIGLIYYYAICKIWTIVLSFRKSKHFNVESMDTKRKLWKLGQAFEIVTVAYPLINATIIDMYPKGSPSSEEDYDGRS